MFGQNGRYREIQKEGPRFSSYAQVRCYTNRIPNYTTPLMRRVGNIQRLWHGTGLWNLRSIATQGLLVSRSGTYCLFGRGIYFAPNYSKAMGFAKGGIDGQYFDFVTLLRCYVALGEVFEATERGNQSQFLSENGYHSIAAKAGVEIKGVWSGSLNYTEVVVYNPEQVVVTDVFIYRRTETYRSSLGWRRPARPENEAVKHHPCRRDKKVCKNAYGSSGCIMTNRKRGCSGEDRLYCPLYE